MSFVNKDGFVLIIFMPLFFFFYFGEFLWLRFLIMTLERSDGVKYCNQYQNFDTEKIFGPDNFTSYFFKILRKKIIPILISLRK